MAVHCHALVGQPDKRGPGHAPQRRHFRPDVLRRQRSASCGLRTGLRHGLLVLSPFRLAPHHACRPVPLQPRERRRFAPAHRPASREGGRFGRRAAPVPGPQEGARAATQRVYLECVAPKRPRSLCGFVHATSRRGRAGLSLSDSRRDGTPGAARPLPRLLCASQVINNGGYHSHRTETGTVTLSAGLHEISANVYERGGKFSFDLRFRFEGASTTNYLSVSAGLRLGARLARRVLAA